VALSTNPTVRDKAIDEQASPIAYFSQIKAPLLVLQARTTSATPKEEAGQAYEVLKESGRSSMLTTTPAQAITSPGAKTRSMRWSGRWLGSSGS
jgi:dipeptidyl aminopeptidase/acylaminoacyl peptidase